MKELTNKRTYNAKKFDNGDGTYKMDAHAGHIHYFNKLGVGDGEKRFREIDWTLNWDDKKRGWSFEYHSFQPFLPEYADSWIEFRDLFEGKDQVVRMKPICNHVKGRLVTPKEDDKISSVNYVVYDDAFGKGFDLILHFTRSQLVKLVRIRDGFKPKEETTFDFEIEFPKDDEDKELSIVRAYKKEDIAYNLDLTKDKQFDTNKQTLIGNDKKDGKEWFTYLRGFKVWDQGIGENTHIETIKVDYFIKDNKKYLRKIVSAEFLDKSVGDIFTDDTTSYYTGAGDGRAGKTAATLTDARSAATADGVHWDYALYLDCFTKRYSSDNDNIQRAFLPISLAALTGATITAADVYVYVTTVNNDDNDGNDYIALIKTTQASASELVVADYSALTLNSPDRGATDIDVSNISASTWLDSGWSMNATGLGWVDDAQGGNLMLGFREGHEIVNSEIIGSGSPEKWVGIYMLPSEAESNDPYISITYTAGGGAVQDLLGGGIIPFAR